MKITKVVQKEVKVETYYCDACGKKLDNREKKFSMPYGTVYFQWVDKNNKLHEAHDSYSINGDYCLQCGQERCDEFLEKLWKLTDSYRIKPRDDKEETVK